MDVWNDGSRFSQVDRNKSTWITNYDAICSPRLYVINGKLCTLLVWTRGPPRCDPTKSNDSIRFLIVLRSHRIVAGESLLHFKAGNLEKPAKWWLESFFLVRLFLHGFLSCDTTFTTCILRNLGPQAKSWRLTGMFNGCSNKRTRQHNSLCLWSCFRLFLQHCTLALLQPALEIYAVRGLDVPSSSDQPPRTACAAKDSAEAQVFNIQDREVC